MTAKEYLKDKQFTVEVNGVYADIDLEDGKLADLLEAYHKHEVEAISDEKAKSLDTYIRAKHTQEECIGFIDGFEKAIELLKQ